MVGNTPALHDLGGFKIDVGFALRVCQECMATKDMIDKIGHIAVDNTEEEYDDDLRPPVAQIS